MADSALPPEADLEVKDTRDTWIGYAPSPLPHENRVGDALDGSERSAADAGPPGVAMPVGGGGTDTATDTGKDKDKGAHRAPETTA